MTQLVLKGLRRSQRPLVVQRKVNQGNWVIQPASRKPPKVLDEFGKKAPAVTKAEQMAANQDRIGVVVAKSDGRFHKFIANERMGASVLADTPKPRIK